MIDQSARYRAGFVEAAIECSPAGAGPWYAKLRELCREVVAPKAEAIDRQRIYPRTSLDALREIGTLGIVAPPDFGGLGFGDAMAALAVEEVSHACPSTGAVLMFHTQVVRRTAMFGTTLQKEHHLATLASGECMGVSCWSEAGAGADKKKTATRIDVEGGEWTIEGAKQYVTGLEGAGVAHVLLGAPAGNGDLLPTFVVVPLPSQGLEVEEVYDLLGLRGSSTGSLSLRAVLLAPSDVIGEVGWGPKLMLANHTCCIHPGMIALGVARSSYEKLLPWTLGEYPGVRCTTDYQNTRFTLADIEVEMGRAYAYAAQAIRYAHRDKWGAGVDCAKVKLDASRASLSVTSAAMRLVGARGFRRDCPFERHWRDSQATLLMGPTNEVVKEQIAAQLSKK